MTRLQYTDGTVSGRTIDRRSSIKGYNTKGTYRSNWSNFSNVALWQNLHLCQIGFLVTALSITAPITYFMIFNERTADFGNSSCFCCCYQWRTEHSCPKPKFGDRTKSQKNEFRVEISYRTILLQLRILRWKRYQ